MSVKLAVNGAEQNVKQIILIFLNAHLSFPLDLQLPLKLKIMVCQISLKKGFATIMKCFIIDVTKYHAQQDLSFTIVIVPYRKKSFKPVGACNSYLIVAFKLK